MKRRSTPQPLTRVDVWHLENVLFKLYRTIQSCVETVDSVSLGLFDLHDSISWIDKDTLITEFFEKPQYYEYGSQSVVDLTEGTFIRLRNFIIETQDLGLAIDLTEQELNLHAFVIFLHNLNDTLQGCLSSIPYLEMLRDFRYEIYKWACFYANRIGSTIDQEMGSRKDDTYLIAENLDSLHIKYRGQDRRPVTITDITDEEAAFDLSDYFIARYDKSRILRIYKHISVLAYEQSDLYISKIISIIAYAHYQGLLSCSYARTIRATLAKFHIEVKPNYLHPATFGQPTEKGNLREAYQEAVAFYASL